MKFKVSPAKEVFGVLLPLLLILLVGNQVAVQVSAIIKVSGHAKPVERQEFYQKPGVRVSEVVKARGYAAEEYQFVSDDGYVLSMTRCHNPLVSRKRARALNKEPLLFIHGTLTDGNSFITNSFDIKQPKDWSSVDADKLSEGQLIERYELDPSAKALPFFAMNFGHEVWFLHRRGSPLSQTRLELSDERQPPPTVFQKYLKSIDYTWQLLNSSSGKQLGNERSRFFGKNQERRRFKRSSTGAAAAAAASLPSEPQENQAANLTLQSSARSMRAAPPPKNKNTLLEAIKSTPEAFFHGHLFKDIQKSFDKRLWNHSLDEQAAYDLPRAVDYVIEKSGFSRTAIIGDSSGGALIIMSLILEQSLNDKLSKAIAWLPAFHIGHTKDKLQNFTAAQPLFKHIGPYPLTFVSLPMQAFLELACSLEIMQKTLCSLGVDANWGPSHGNQVFRAEFGAGYMTPVSAHEYLHLLQFHSRQESRMFDFGDKKLNRRAYGGQEDTPRYNASLINFEHLSMYVASSDTLVTERDIEKVHKEMRVPHRIVTMRSRGANHGAVLFHNDVASMVTIPTYKDIISHGYNGQRSGTSDQNHGFNEIDGADDDDTDKHLNRS